MQHVSRYLAPGVANSPQPKPVSARAIDRLTRRNPNPTTGEAHYHLGLSLRYLGKVQRPTMFVYKATWNAARRGPGAFRLGGDRQRTRFHFEALAHVEEALRHDVEIQ